MLLLAAGVSESRGAALGTFLPAVFGSKAARWVLWGCHAASSGVRTGVTQASRLSKILHHSSCVLLAKISVNLSRNADQSWNCGASSGWRPRPKTVHAHTPFYWSFFLVGPIDNLTRGFDAMFTDWMLFQPAQTHWASLLHPLHSWQWAPLPFVTALMPVPLSAHLTHTMSSWTYFFISRLKKGCTEVSVIKQGNTLSSCHIYASEICILHWQRKNIHTK